MLAVPPRRLLRVQQERTTQRVGGKEPVPVDASIIAATHRDPEKAIRKRLFRDDLFYRLSVVTILPPLADCAEDRL